MRRNQKYFPPLATVLVLAGGWATPGSAQTEGYDPLRQITKQLVKANFLIVLDTTGSMGGDVNGVGLKDVEDSTGRLSWFQTSPNTDVTIDPGADSRGNSRCKPNGFTTGNNPVPKWDKNQCSLYKYQMKFELPSRLASVKNALGNSVSVILDYTAPGAAPQPSAGSWTTGNPTPVTSCTLASAGKLTTTSAVFNCAVDYGLTGAAPNYRSNPGFPYNAYDANGISSGPAYGVMGAVIPPQDVIGKNASKVNWGLEAFSTSRASCAVAELKVKIDTSDSNDVSAIESFLQLKKNAGLSAGGGTNTIGAMTFAKAIMQTTYSGGTLVDHAGVSTSMTEDPRYECNRPYGVILATDGLSNTCNTANGDWISPCGTCPGPSCCDTVSSAYDCPANWANFSAARADEIWNLNLGSASAPPIRKSPPINPRVWTIGVSPEVGPCELDYIAYMGRTDAESPSGDAGYGGFQPDSKLDFYNPYLPDPAITTGPNGIPSTYDGPTGQFKAAKFLGQDFNPPTNSHGHNAFFATSPKAVSDAVEAIINSTATGNYTTNSPTSGASVGDGSSALLPSAEFPSWKGHLYKYTYDPAKKQGDPGYQTFVWDAGETLKTTPSASRQIYTWDSSNNLVRIDSKPATLASLQAIAASNGVANASTVFTAKVVDFILGNDGSGAGRSWKLGPLINTTPAITAAPFAFKQAGKTPVHIAFEATYSKRVLNALAWVGSDDGMMHAFRYDSGVEELAILPPNLLGLQVQLAANFDPVKKLRVTGQPIGISNHLYGTASSLRFTDVWFQKSGSTPADYHTVGFLTEGPGGTLIAAIDITHPAKGSPADATKVPPIPAIPADANYDATNPVKILWSVTGGAGAGQINGLFTTWSVPALAATSYSNWTLIFGSGPNPNSVAGAQIAPKVFTMDLSGAPTSPTVNTLNLSNTATSLVGNQAFAPSVLFSTLAPAYFSDNVADLGLQADLDGRIWFSTGTTLKNAPYVGIDATAIAGGKSQPLYYPPAVSGYGFQPAPKGCDLFAFGSGSFYEKNPAISDDIGSGTKFYPNIYIAVNPKPSAGSPAAAISSAAQVTKIQLSNGLFSDGADVNPVFFQLGPRTQLTAAPFIIVPLNGTPGKNPAQALFIVYDPDKGCNGNAYVISIEFDLGATCGSSLIVDPKKTIAYDAGPGAASGFTVINGKVGVAKSAIGKVNGAAVRAGIFVTKASVVAGTSSSATPIWWKELK